MLEGKLELLQYAGGASRWITAAVGDTVCIPADAKHAFGNNSSTAQAALLFATTPNIYNFLREFGKPYDPDRPPAADPRRYAAHCGASPLNTATG